MGINKIASLGAFCCIIILVGCSNDESSDFTGDVEQFFIEPATPLPEVEFQRRGKILALDTDRRRLDPLHDTLPVGLRARRPEEVGTVALVSCEIRESGRYGYFFAKAYGQLCSLRLIDAMSRTFLANTGVSYPPPSRVYLPFWSRTAARPTHLLLDNILRLPDRSHP